MKHNAVLSVTSSFFPFINYSSFYHEFHCHSSIPPTAVSKVRQFRSPHICLCLSEKTLKADGPFYLVSMPGEVKDPTQGGNM